MRRRLFLFSVSSLIFIAFSVGACWACRLNRLCIHGVCALLAGQDRGGVCAGRDVCVLRVGQAMGAVHHHGTRREYIPVGSRAASLPHTDVFTACPGTANHTLHRHHSRNAGIQETLNP